MGEAIRLATDVFLQRGNTMQRQNPEHPNICDLSKGVLSTGSGRKILQMQRAITLLLEIHYISRRFWLNSNACAISNIYIHGRYISLLLKKKANVRLRFAQLSRHQRPRINTHLELICNALSAVPSRKMMCYFATIQRMVLLKYVIGDIMGSTALQGHSPHRGKYNRTNINKYIINVCRRW